MRNKKLFLNFIVLFVTLIILLILSEIAFRIYYAKTNRIIAIDEEEKCLKGILEKVSNESDPNRFTPGFVQHDFDELEYSNITGVTLKNDIHKNTNWTTQIKPGIWLNVFGYETNTNSQNMRAIKDFDYEQNPRITRIAVLGDSYTWGADIPFNFTYASILEQLIPNSEALNFGIKGIGIDMMYLRWKYEALKFNPDIVVMTIFTDDIRRAQPCIQKPTFKIEDGRLMVSNIPPPSYEEIFKQYKKPKFESYLLKHSWYNLKYIKGVTKTQYDYGFDILPLILDEMKAESEKYGTFFMVAIINAESGVYSGYEEEAVKRLKALLEEKKTPYVDMFEIFKSEGFQSNDNRLYYGHLSPIGNALFAQGIKNKLEKEKIIPKYDDYYFNHNPQKQYLLTLRNKKNPDDMKYINSLDLTFFNESGVIDPPSGLEINFGYLL